MLHCSILSASSSQRAISDGRTGDNGGHESDLERAKGWMGGGTGGGDPAIRCGHAIRINPGCKQVTTRNQLWNVQKVDLRPTLLHGQHALKQAR